MGKCKVLVTCHEHDASPTIGSLCVWLKEDGQRQSDLGSRSLCSTCGTTSFFLLSSIAGCECLCYIFFFRLRCVMVASWCVARADSNLASRRNFNIDDTAQRILHDNIIIPIHIYISNGNEGVEFPGDWLPRSVRTIALCAMLWEPMRQQQTIFHLPPSHPLCLIILPSCISLSLSSSQFMLL